MKIAFILFFVLPRVLFLPMFANAGGISSGGGDSIAAEFIRIAKNVSQMIEKNPVSGVDSTSFKSAILYTFVISKPRTFWNNTEVNAVNYPDIKRIEINQHRWNKMNIREKYALVAHEYFGILKIDDKAYQISNTFFLEPGIISKKFICDALYDIKGLENYKLIVEFFNNFVDVNIENFQGEMLQNEYAQAFGTIGAINNPNSVNLKKIKENLAYIFSLNIAGLKTRIISIPINQPQGKFLASAVDIAGLYQGGIINNKISCSIVSK